MNYLIIGGVAGGATVAARLRRMDEKANIILFERGKYVSYANCGLPYYIGDTINNREKLFVQTAKGFTDRFRIDIRTEQEVTAIRPDNKEVEIRESVDMGDTDFRSLIEGDRKYRQDDDLGEHGYTEQEFEGEELVDVKNDVSDEEIDFDDDFGFDEISDEE